MHRLSLASCSRPAARPSVLANAPKVFSRARHDGGGRKPLISKKQRAGQIYGTSEDLLQRQAGRPKHQEMPDFAAELKRAFKQSPFREARRTKTFSEEELVDFMAEKVKDWKNQAHIQRRFVSYGIPAQQVPLLLNQFVHAVQSKRVLTRLEYTEAQKDRLAYDLSDTNNLGILDEHFSRIFFEWAANPAQRKHLNKYVPSTTLEAIAQLFHAVDMSHPPNVDVFVRTAPPRKIIMHVGPTNSGKTHNALRALAAAERGLYAGPLRLLAHEIFDRLNKGQIIPLGMEAAPDAELDEDTNIEAGEPIVVKQGNTRFARACNLITGEEQRIVAEDAGLSSCTVEMVTRGTEFLDVAVIDEIQMISEPERGGAWTAALLGVNAREVHLCGEERAVPLVRELLKDTHDELVVHKYERLTPLEVADYSLHGDLSKIEKGDCLVSFSRNSIFKMKAEIEKATGLRCAVIYGGLPPEIRNAQAARFNTPGSGYDVIVGSDAIGMGLNLKIKRIVFGAVRKWTGEREELLSLSSFKQISGRAGRFGLHEDQAPGIVTTLWDADLPIVRKALDTPIEPIRYACLHASIEQFMNAMQALPSGTSLSTIQQTFKYVSKLHPAYEYESTAKRVDEFAYIDSVASELTLSERLLLRNSPISWRDPEALRAVMHMMQMMRDDLRVDLQKLMQLAGFRERLDDVREFMASGRQRGFSDELLLNLETMHKTLSLYLWMSYRVPVAFTQTEEARATLRETEEAMEWLLEHMSKAKPVAAPGPGTMHSWQSPRHNPDRSHWEESSSTYSGVGSEENFGLRHAAATM